MQNQYNQQTLNAERARVTHQLMLEEQLRQAAGVNPLITGAMAGGVAALTGLTGSPQGAAQPSQKQANVFGDMLDAGLVRTLAGEDSDSKIERLEARIADLEARIWDE